MSYLYATGRIRVLEKNLLSESTVERMIGAQDAHQSYRALTETDYAPLLERYPQPQQVEELVMRHLRDSRIELQKMVGTEGPIQILWRKYDFHNLRATIKAKILNKDSEYLKPLLVPLGSRTRKVWLDFFETEDPKELRKEWIEVYHQSLESYKHDNNPHKVDLLVDQEYYLALRLMAERYSPFFSGYAKRLIDLYNITLRIRISDDQKFKNSFASGGYLNIDKFHSLEGLESLIAGAGKGYDVLRQNLLLCREDKSYALFEKNADNLILDYLYRSKRISYGPEPVFSYWLAKKNNAMIIRTIIIAKLTGLDQKVIREHLRNVY